MKKLLLFFLLSLFGFAQIGFSQHLKKDGTPDRRYKENRVSTSYHPSSYSHRTIFHHKSTYTYGVARDIHGRIKRSESAKREFMRETGYPKGRPGYVVDHINPLKRGGCDCPANMQWQTKEEARLKDKRE